MNNNPLKKSSSFLEVSVPSSIIVDLETLALHLKMMFSGQPTEINVFAPGLMRLIEWAKNRTPAVDNSASVGWSGRYVGLPKLGGTLICRNTEQELMLSMDSENVVYMGSWRSLRPGEDDHGGIFTIENASSGQILVLDTGLTKQQFQLPDSEYLTWGSVAGFLQGIQDDEPSQTEISESQPGLASRIPVSQPEVTDVELSPDAAPTILARPARQSSENAERNPVSVKQPTIIKPTGWQCVCGSNNAGQFCPKCGREKPAPVVAQKNAPVQPAFCKQCGGTISPGSRFCRNCGAELIK